MTVNIMRRFELSDWEQGPRLTHLRNTVAGLLTKGRNRSALDEVLRYLRRDPENTDALFVALLVAYQSRTARLASGEPLTDMQRLNALLAPITTECSACRSGWFSTHAILAMDGGGEITVANPIGLQCQACRYTLCRDCLRRSNRPRTQTPSTWRTRSSSCARTRAAGATSP
ncbi:hypothetical protein ACFQ0M_04940 [Kitasatospora aburaviensis]